MYAEEMVKIVLLNVLGIGFSTSPLGLYNVNISTGTRKDFNYKKYNINSP